jgi:hypothetical protein
MDRREIPRRELELKFKGKRPMGRTRTSNRSHREERKYLTRNREVKIVGDRRDWGLLVYRPVSYRNDARRTYLLDPLVCEIQ